VHLTAWESIILRSSNLYAMSVHPLSQQEILSDFLHISTVDCSTKPSFLLFHDESPFFLPSSLPSLWIGANPSDLEGSLWKYSEGCTSSDHVEVVVSIQPQGQTAHCKLGLSPHIQWAWGTCLTWGLLVPTGTQEDAEWVF
jgi:hypothetical protein